MTVTGVVPHRLTESRPLLMKLPARNPALEALASREPVLPCVPRLLALMTHEVGRPEPDLRKLCQWIGADPALTVLTLRMANANRFRQSAQVANIAQALAVLGPVQLRSITQVATTAGMPRQLPDLPLAALWRCSVNTAKIARALAGSLRLDACTAFSAGLMHALGEIAIVSDADSQACMAQSNVPPLGPLRAAAESAVLGFHYADVIAHWAAEWCWPQVLVDTLRHQVHPFEGEVCEPLAGVLHLAAWRARAREAGLHGNELTVSFPFEIGVPLGLDIDAVLQQDPIDWNSRLTATWY